jgi:8-oxo-dGTP pyrophosphatase MutT (NUDIX family)
MQDSTYDGLPISREPPFGATVVIYRRMVEGIQLLLLHRAHHGPAFEGDWAWTPPAGSRWPGEDIDECAQRELLEEVGLALPLTPTDCGSIEWLVYVAEAQPDVTVRLDEEHDRYAWVSPAKALGLCAPSAASEPLTRAVSFIRSL